MMKKQKWIILSMTALVTAVPARADLPLTVRALAGDSAGLAPGVNFSLFTFASNSAPGNRIAFGSALSGVPVTSANDSSIFFSDLIAPTLVAREGDPSPTSGGETFNSLTPPTINASGTIFFRSTLLPSGNGYFRKSPGVALELLAKNGSFIDNSSTVLVGSGASANRLPIDAAGNGYIHTSLTGTSVTMDDANALLRANGTGITTLVRSGITVPAGVPVSDPPIRFELFNAIDANASGQVAFQAILRNAASGNDLGIWRIANGTMAKLVIEGDSAPGITGATFSVFSTGISIGDDGSVGFCATLAGPGITPADADSIWVGKPGALRRVVREGDIAPGLDTGAEFDNLVYIGFTDIAPALNPDGRAAFLARLRGPGITTTNDDSLWVEDGNGTLRLVLREGSLIPSGNSMEIGVGSSDPNFPPITLDPSDGFSHSLRLVFCAETFDGGSFDGIYEAAVPGDSVKPVVKISGPPSRRSKRPIQRLTGIATDNNAVLTVEVKPRGSGYRPAAGTTRWSFNARLKKGTNRILVRASDAAGNVSPIASVTVRKS